MTTYISRHPPTQKNSHEFHPLLFLAACGNVNVALALAWLWLEEKAAEIA